MIFARPDTNRMQNFLLITYYWPPASGPGVQRWLKMCKYIEKHGWRPIILTVQDGTYPAKDEKLLTEVEEHWQVEKTKSFEPLNYYNRLRGTDPKKSVVGIDQSTQNTSWYKKKISEIGLYLRANVFIPDARMGWRKYAVKRALRLIDSQDIQAIVTTGPPQSTHLIGLDCKGKTGIPWLADFRDPWTTAYYNSNLNRSQRAIAKDQKLETSVLNNANAVTCVSPAMVDEFEERCKLIELVYNGYDPMDFENVTRKANARHFEMHYIGTLKNLEIQPDLWLALAELIQESSEFRERFRLHFTGNIAPSVQRSLAEYNLEGHVVYHGFSNHATAIQRMHDAHLLLLIIADLPGNEKVITGKIFEYLASGTPIFAIGPRHGGADQVLQKSQRGPILPYKSKSDYKKNIYDQFCKWLAQPTAFHHRSESSTSGFSRDHQAMQIANILNRISRKGAA